VTQPRQIHVLWVTAALFSAACLLLATRAGTWLAPGPRFEVRDDSLIIEGDRLRDCLPAESDRVGTLREGVRLYADVDLTFRAVVPRGAPLQIFVVARARSADGVWPLLTLHVDRDHRGGFFVDAGEWRLHRADLNLTPGEHHIRVSYVNDRARFPADRNVDLLLVGVGEVPATIAGRFPVAAEPRQRDVVKPLELTPGTHVVGAHGFDLDSGSTTADGARTLWSAGYLGRTVLVKQAQHWRIALNARGEWCEGGGPRVLLVVGEEQIVAWDVGGGDGKEYTTELNLEPGTHEVFLVYENDRIVPGVCDRNLHVAELRFETFGPSSPRVE
jgi:hypothetical protein